MRVDMRSGAFNGRRSARGMAPQVDDARCDVGMTRVLGQADFRGLRVPPEYGTIKLASRGGECESVVYTRYTRNAC